MTPNTASPAQSFDAEVRSAVLYEKSHSVVQCNYVWKRTDQWINFPWSDKEPVARRDWSVKDA